MDDDSWDSIDWDQKISDVKQIVKEVKNIKFVTNEESDGNYYESNQKKNKEKFEQKKSHKKIQKSHINYVTPFAHKDLCEIRSSEFHQIIFKVYGEFERYLATHEENLSDESLVEVLKINAQLLQVPFIFHNRLFTQRLVKIDNFWKQISSFIKLYYEKNRNDPKYLLLIDTKSFFRNLESLIFYFVTHNFLGETTIKDLITSVVNDIKSYKEIDETSIGFKINDLTLNVTESAFEVIKNNNQQFFTYYVFLQIYPKLSDLKNNVSELEKNVINNRYRDVLHYLNVQLPLLKEDFMCKLRNSCNHLTNIPNTVDKREKFADGIIIPHCQIQKIFVKVWNINCPLIIAKINIPVNIFNGQLICFTSSKNLNDLIVATVLRNNQLELHIPSNSIIIEIIRIENITDIFNRDLIMIEPNTFFDPYCQVFAALKSMNEYNFPFQKAFLNLCNEPNVPNYQQLEDIFYQGHTISLSETNWEKFNLGLMKMQLEALKNAIFHDLTLIVGPPGTGKSFIGIEILRILLDNSKEKILVLTQTNNALDKFLLGCLKFTDKIVRFGAQSKEKELANYLVKHQLSQDSKNYLRKLQIMQRDIVNNLVENEANAEDVFKEISFHYRLVEEVNQLNSYQNNKDMRIFGMTTSFAAHNSSLTKMLNAGIVIIEEASEILESHILSSISTKTKQIIMIGDHNQLRPQTNSFDLQTKFNFNISLYERLIMNKFPHISLDVQMRMRPEFCELIRETIYKDLKDGENVKIYPNVNGINRNFFFYNHTHLESSSETSKENLYEVDLVCNFYKKLLSLGNNANDITILTPYAAQSNKFKDKLRHMKLPHVRVAVLDAYQGEESEIILLSLVRSNKNHDIGFLSMKNRISVILSRAKIGFYIFGNIECFSNGSSRWKKIGEILVKHNAIINEIPSEFFEKRTRLTSKN